MNRKVIRKSVGPTYYSDAFKREICQAYLNSDLSKQAISAEYGLKGKASLLNWLRKFGYLDHPKTVKTPKPFMSKSKKEIKKDGNKEMEDLKLQVEMYKRMIEIAEKEFKISIVKKSNTK